MIAHPWRPAPIDPSWILSGSAQAETRHIAHAGHVSAGFWRCTPGTFLWRYSVDETIVIITGLAWIDGKRYGPGSTVVFKRGTQAKWTIVETVTKMYVIEARKSVLRRAAGRVRRMLRTGKRLKA